MKRKITAIAALLMLGCGIVSADGINGEYKGHSIVRIVSNGHTITDDEVPAHIIDGATMVPLRMLRKLGATVTWNGDDYSVDVKMPKQHANVLSQAELDSLASSVGEVFVYDASGNMAAQGSGFVIPGNVFVTNCHVACDAASVKVKMRGKEFTITKALIVDRDRDIYKATLELPSTLRFAKELPEKGDKVYAIGYPDGYAKITTGSVVSTDSMWVENTAEIWHGSSGGVLLNEYGEVTGVASGKFQDTGNYASRILLN